MSVIIETSVGDLTIDLLVRDRPRCSFNFLKLCKLKYYNLCFFHRIERDFIAQTGDPSETGKGGQSVYHLMDPSASKFFPAEIVPKIKHTQTGTVSMVNNGDDCHGSQFFITLRNDLDNLDGIHTVFGYVTEGQETLEKINEMYFKDIIITHVIVLHDPFNNPPIIEKALSSCNSPEPDKETLERIAIANNIGGDEVIDIKVQESRAAATILEMVGDLPSEDALPPDNVLFVCKLNPVTKDEDLKIIFERFGPIISCEIIKDHKSGESLQYGFIEFEKADHCENAYFKMDNVIIDERRIHVDFSQSVAKMPQSSRFKEYASKYRQYKQNKISGGSKNLSAKSREHGRENFVKKRERQSRSRSRDRSDRYRNDYQSSRSHHSSRDQEDQHKNRYDSRKHRHYDQGRDRDKNRDRNQGRDRDRDRGRNRESNRERDRNRDRHRR